MDTFLEGIIYVLVGLAVLVANHLWLGNDAAANAIGIALMGAGAGFSRGVFVPSPVQTPANPQAPLKVK